MYKEYVKENTILEKSEEEKKQELIVSIIKKKKELEESNKKYKYNKNELINYYLYRKKENQAKLEYLIKKAKTNGISIDRINELYIRKNKVV